MHNIIVQKYGGTSLDSLNKLKKIAHKIVQLKKKGYSPVIVVSAMGKSTDKLSKMAYTLNPNPSSREMDSLLSTGEHVSISLLAMAVESLGQEVISLTGYQCGIKTCHQHKNARIEHINTKRLEDEIQKGKIIIVAGFQGMTQEMNISTLGRGGSDTTAVALAAALKAQQCEIYTDVEGVYTSDPRCVKNAKLLDFISYEEMLEFSKLGAQVLHPRSVELAKNNGVKLLVKSSFSKSIGSSIEAVKDMEEGRVCGVTIDHDVARITVVGVPDKPGIAFKLFDLLSQNDICIDMIIQNLTKENLNDISFTVAIEKMTPSVSIAFDYLKLVGAESVKTKNNVSKLSIIGTGITSNPNMASKMFGCLYEMGVNIEMISTSETRISCIIDQETSNDVLNKIHEKFIKN